MAGASDDLQTVKVWWHKQFESHPEMRKICNTIGDIISKMEIKKESRIAELKDVTDGQKHSAEEFSDAQKCIILSYMKELDKIHASIGSSEKLNSELMICYPPKMEKREDPYSKCGVVATSHEILHLGGPVINELERSYWRMTNRLVVDLVIPLSSYSLPMDAVRVSQMISIKCDLIKRIHNNLDGYHDPKKIMWTIDIINSKMVKLAIEVIMSRESIADYVWVCRSTTAIYDPQDFRTLIINTIISAISA